MAERRDGVRALLLRSGAFRLAAFQAALFAVIAASLFGVTWWSVRIYVERQIRDGARDELQELARAIGPADAAEAAGRLAGFQRGAGEFVGVFDAVGRRLAGDFDVLPAIGGDQRVAVRRTDAGAAEVVDAHVVRGRSVAGEWLAAGVNRRDADELLQTLARAFLGAGALAFGAALAGGFLTSRRYLRRVEAIADAAARIVAGRLDTRLPLGHKSDEIDRLTDSLNAMWGRIESLLEGMKQVSTDMAHELRTPLTHLRLRLERARDTASDAAAVRSEVEAALQEVDRGLALFGALLRVAQIEARQRQAGFEPLELAQLVEAIAADFRPLFEDEGRELALQIDPAVRIIGDRTLIVQLLVNLLENVLRHTVPGTPAGLQLARAGAAIELTLRDAGPGIPPPQRERVLRRLVRLDPSRGTAGAGLGLALVKAIADLHEARLSLEDAAPGLRVRVRFAAPPLTNR